MNTSSRLVIIIGYRNREIIRVKRCLDSLTRQTNIDFNLIFVDYGSDETYSQEVRKVVETYPFCEYIYSETRGYPWSRSKALNIGVRQAESDYVLTTDVDMIFADNFVETVLQCADPKQVVNCAPIWLPRRFQDWEDVSKYQDRYPTGDSAQLGGCQCVSTQLMKKIRGFDEYYKYWGLEDRDLNSRLIQLGIEQVWVNEHTGIYHQWHKKKNYITSNYIPFGLWGRMLNHYHQNQDVIYRNIAGWGNIFVKEDRPVLKYIDFKRNEITDGVTIFHESPFENRFIGKVVEQFWHLPAGTPFAVDNAFLPPSSFVFEYPLWWLNRLLWKTKVRINFSFGANYVHSYLDEFIENNSDIIADYYLGFPVRNGVTVLLKK